MGGDERLTNSCFMHGELPVDVEALQATFEKLEVAAKRFEEDKSKDKQAKPLIWMPLGNMAAPMRRQNMAMVARLFRSRAERFCKQLNNLMSWDIAKDPE